MSADAALRPRLGWPLLPVPDEQGRLAYRTLEQSVREAIEVILRTRPGEQLMRPGFGAGLTAFLHEQNTLATRRRIRDTVLESLTRWEPRILLDRVEVWEVARQPTQVRVEILYRLRCTGAPQRVGLSMDVGT